MADPPAGGGMWDERFDRPEFYFGREPNAFLASKAALVHGGLRALVPGDGEGRNGVWLARQGCRVTSVDASGVGLVKARRLAAEHKVEIETIQANLTDWSWPEATFDLVAAIYFHMPAAERNRTHRRMLATLRPGGLLILEGFALAQTAFQLTEGSGGPPDPTMLFTLEALREDFREAEIEELAEAETVLAEGSGHRGRAAVIRMLARRRPLAGLA